MLLAFPLPNRDEPRSFLGWLVPLSIGLHVALVTALPSSAPRVHSPPPVVEIVDAPPPPPKPKPAARAPAPPAREPARQVEKVRPAVQAAREETPPPAAGPVDFTSAVFSNDGPGMALASGPASVAPPAPVATTPRKVQESAPTIVPAASLGRPPRAPGLDVELERNYPTRARQMGISGTAVLRVMLFPDGRVGKVERVSESYPGFGDACERTVRAGRWEPPLDREGHPVGTEIKYVCKFEVRS